MKTGTNYNPSLTIKEITTIVRKEIATKFKGVKAIVKQHGTCIKVLIIDPGFKPFTQDFCEKNISWSEYQNQFDTDIFSENLHALKSDIMQIVQSYNCNNSDISTDYFESNFSGIVELDNFQVFIKYLPDSEDAIKYQSFLNLC